MEKLKKFNGKLYTLVKKMLQAEKNNFELKDQISNIEDCRKDIRIGYQKITTALGFEEKVRKRIEEAKEELGAKRISVESLRKRLDQVRNQTEDTVNKIENSVVKEIMKRINELRENRTYYQEEMKILRDDIAEFESQLEITKKNPKKIPPAVANQNLRAEVKGLETKITERSKDFKELEREKSRCNFHLEEMLKALTALRAKAEIVFAKPEVPQPKKEVTEKTCPTPATQKGNAGMKKIEAKRDSVLDILGRGDGKGMTSEVMKVLKGVGKPGQGVASKVLELNRSQFNQARPVISK